MNKNLSIYYDKEGDLLEIRIGKPTIGYFKDLGNDIFERIDEKTGEMRLRNAPNEYQAHIEPRLNTTARQEELWDKALKETWEKVMGSD